LLVMAGLPAIHAFFESSFSKTGMPATSLA
jgi:hypothetical protein